MKVWLRIAGRPLGQRGRSRYALLAASCPARLPFLRLSGVLLRVLVEFCFAVLAAEIIILPLMVGTTGGILFIYLHPADRIRLICHRASSFRQRSELKLTCVAVAAPLRDRKRTLQCLLCNPGRKWNSGVVKC